MNICCVCKLLSQWLNCINAIAKFSGIICECCGIRKTENCLLCPFGVLQGIVESRRRDTLLFCNLVEFEFSFLRAGFRRRIFPLMEKASVALTEHRNWTQMRLVNRMVNISSTLGLYHMWLYHFVNKAQQCWWCYGGESQVCLLGVGLCLIVVFFNWRI